MLVDKVKFLNLKPSDIIKISKGTERAFFKKNVIDAPNAHYRKHVYVASLKDSILGDFIPYVKNITQDTATKMTLTIRMALDEEREVLEYKLKKER